MRDETVEAVDEEDAIVEEIEMSDLDAVDEERSIVEAGVGEDETVAGEDGVDLGEGV